MDLTNKELTIRYMTTNNTQQTSTVSVEVSSSLVDGIYSVDGTYQINFDTLYQGINDPLLMPAIVAKLESLP